MLKFKPLGNRIVVKPIQEQKSTGGIIVTDQSKEKPEQGEVVAISLDSSSTLKVGDRVVFGKYSGVDLRLDTSLFLLMNVDDVLGIIPEESASV
jgi:chaperonin GroES